MDPAERTLSYDGARAICRKHARSFYFASHFLPQAKREHAYAVYAVCRLIDDVIDRPLDGSRSCAELDERLVALTNLLHDIYANRLQLPPILARTPPEHALRAFSETVRACEIPQQYFLDVIEGCRIDLTVKRYANFAELERYCYLVAGVVGLIMCRVFGLREQAAEKHAILMGNAMQLTNILRDVREDCERGRIYLPQDELQQFHVSEEQVQSNRMSAEFVELMRFEIDRARKQFNAGAEGLAYLAADGSRQTASVMAVVYAGILGAIERLDYNVFADRARLSLPQKVARLPRAWKLWRRERDEPLPDAFGT